MIHAEHLAIIPEQRTASMKEKDRTRRSSMNREDREFAERLVLEVERRPIIYDNSHPNHRERQKVDKEWAGIAAKLHSSIEVVKKRWQNLRGSYSKCLGAQMRPPEPGVKSCTKFYLFDQMKFLKRHIMSQYPSSIFNKTFESITEGYPEMLTENGDESEDRKPLTMPHAISPSSNIPSPTPSGTEPIVFDPAIFQNSSLEPQNCRKRLRDQTTAGIGFDPIHSHWGELEEVADEDVGTTFPYVNSQHHSHSKIKKSSDLSFFKGILPMVRDLSKRRKLMFFAKVTNLLMEELDEQEKDVTSLGVNGSI